MARVTKQALWRGVRALSEPTIGRDILTQPHLSGLPIVAVEESQAYIDLRAICQHVTGQVVVLVQGPHEVETSRVHVILWHSDFGNPKIPSPADQLPMGELAELMRRDWAYGAGPTATEQEVLAVLPKHELVTA